MKSLYTGLFFCLLSATAFPHTDMCISYRYGKVKGSTCYSFSQHEEHRKARIIAQWANMLLEKHHFKDDVIIIFQHYCVKDSTAYELSYQPLPENVLYHDDTADKGKEQILLTVRSRKYNTREILQLLEYAISHTKQIKKMQKERKVSRGFRTYDAETKEETEVFRTFTTVDSDSLEPVLKQPASETIKEVMSMRIYRPVMDGEKIQGNLFTYYVENEQNYIIYRNGTFKNKPDSLLLTLDHIYQFDTFADRRLVVFDSASSFYMINKQNANFISGRRVIDPRMPEYYPFSVVNMGNIIGISFAQRKTEMQLRPNRNLIYRVDDDFLIQDINAVLDSISGYDPKIKGQNWAFF